MYLIFVKIIFKKFRLFNFSITFIFDIISSVFIFLAFLQKMHQDLTVISFIPSLRAKLGSQEPIIYYLTELINLLFELFFYLYVAF